MGVVVVAVGIICWTICSFKKSNNAFELIQMIMKSNYFNGVSEKKVIYNCMEGVDRGAECQEYIDILLKYLDKNRYGLQLSIHYIALSYESRLERTFEIRQDNGKWLNIFFNICDKVNEAPNIKRYTAMLKQCCKRGTKDEYKYQITNKKREELEPILKENFNKFYPNEKLENFLPQ